MTWRALREETTAVIGAPHETRILLEQASAKSALELLACLDEPVPSQVRERLDEMVARRRCGEPLQHIVGHWPFRHVELSIDRRALIPRPETEIVVEVAIAELERQEDAGGPKLAIDLGTGSGAIACALVNEVAELEVVAVDIDENALELAACNRARLEPSERDRLRFYQGDFYAALPANIADDAWLIIANPPYIAAHEWADLPSVVRDFDPHLALVSGPTGLEAIEAVVSGAPQHLRAGGVLVVEISPEQSEQAKALALQAGARDVAVEQDLTGRDRVLVARF